MQKIVIVVLVVCFLLGVGCTKSVRYTEYEIQKFPSDIQENIRKGEINLGMTQQQVRYAWGSPNSIKFLEPMAKGTTREEWVYTKLGIFGTKLLVFLDGKLIYVNE